MALSLDGTASIYATSGTSFATGTLTCSNAGNVICVAITKNGAGDVSSVTGTGATFTFRAKSATGANNIEWWTGYAAGTFSSAVTVNMASSASFATVHAFGVNGAPSSSYFDTHSGIPTTNTSDADLTISTSNADDFIFGGYREGSTDNPSAGTGFTRILGGTGSGYQLTEYKIVSSTQTSLAIARGSSGVNGGVGDAIIKASASAATTQIHGWVAG
jgi:hypothetical protein